MKEDMTRLQKYRKESGLSQSQLSAMSGISVRHIQNLEQKNRDINKTQGITLYKLSKVLCCHIEDLLELKEIEKYDLK